MLRKPPDARSAGTWPELYAIQAAANGVKRRLESRTPDVATMGLDQAITLEESIRIHTLNGAWTLRLDDDTGTIEVGKYADMIVLNHNLFEIEPTEIHDTKVQKTIFKGRVVYQAE